MHRVVPREQQAQLSQGDVSLPIPPTVPFLTLDSSSLACPASALSQVSPAGLRGMLLTMSWVMDSSTHDPCMAPIFLGPTPKSLHVRVA